MSVIDPGAPVIVLRGDARYAHLPAPRPVTVGRPVHLDEVLDAGGTPNGWQTLCGQRGDVFLYRGALQARPPCPSCVMAHARGEHELAEAASA
jgi:hypothetical protein